MIVRLKTPGARRHSARLAAVLSAAFAAALTAGVSAQQVTNPGDIIVERDITPRSAFANVPKNQDPVLVRATTFPKNTFDPTMAALVTDTDLTNAHGNSGVNTSGALAGGAAGVQAINRILVGNPAGSNSALGAGGSAQAVGGLGGTISSTVTGALAPITSALGAIGGVK
ncbi:hypothetical protein [Paraburkholderia tagetis]|uniref:Extended Signal Peptide of Type V secretion system n=1 Tax=Paraburkholderia tagetis TaxID=2913261 RepID=A0A9X1UFQ0_9BURK|nr:hypothetical protein [Paraburkholderia tagetis]MCG5074560.1 hypothetical protein [Paraburkholderia tagetis]